MSKTFSRKVLLKELIGCGVEAASASDRPSSPEVPPVKGSRVALDQKTFSQIAQKIGPLAAYASSYTRNLLRDVEYSIFKHHLGNAHIGFVSTKTNLQSIYLVGRIENIFEVHQGQEKPSRVVYMVRCYKPAPATMWTTLRDRLLSHRALGIHVVGSEMENNVQAVTKEEVIGHVAILPVDSLTPGAYLTVQLSTVK
jgi:hypothetical protein